MPFSTKPGPKGPVRFSFITLGCKSNQYDSAAMEADLRRAGLTSAEPAGADVILVNTCMVTGPAQSQCRKTIRQVRRANPKAKVIAAGCMARGAREQLACLPEVDLILDPGQKGKLASLLGFDSGESGIGGWSDWPPDPAVIPDSRDRAFLKIQEGCDSACSFCIVPSVRGCSRSLHPKRVLDTVRRLMESGFLEVVLTGIHLGQYGRGLERPVNLDALLRDLLDAGLPGRVRLSSMEPLEITDELVKTMKLAGGFVCRHVHVPVQSGSDRILRLMRRPYTVRELGESLSRLRDAIPGIGLGCDMICGFPGETADDFARTEKLLADFAIPFVHAFPYSPRPGTGASRLKDDVPYREKKDRVRRLISLAGENRKVFADRQAGFVLTAAIETGTRNGPGIWGLTDNYLRVAVRKGEGLTPGELVDLYIEGITGDTLEGKVSLR